MKAPDARREHLIACALTALVALTHPALAAHPAGGVRFSRGLEQSVAVLDDFPLQIGARGSYRHLTKDLMGATPSLIVVRWIEDIEVVGHREMPEGKLILRRITIRDLTCEHPDSARPEDVECCRQRPARTARMHDLIQGNYVFEVSPEDLTAERAAWFREHFRRSDGNAREEPLPRFCFPMDQVDVWAERARELAAMEEVRRFEAGLAPAFCVARSVT